MASIDLPNDFDYEKAVADEFGKSGATNNPRWWHSWKALVALLLLLLFIGGLLRGVAGPG